MKLPEKILQAKKCGDLFSRADKDTVTAEYRRLAKEFHPDHCSLSNANEIMSRLNELYAEAIRLIDAGEWEISNMIELRGTDGKRYRTKYLKSYQFELGTMYVADLSVTYVFDKEHEQFFENALEQIKSLQYKNSKMEDEISRYMPKLRYSFKTLDGKFCIILSKTQEVYLLSDVLDAYNGVIPDRHAAWIMSRFCNICCYFQYLGIAHNGLTLQTCFISPQYHTVLPLGGWWYAKKIGERLLGVPRSVYNVMPIKAKSSKISDFQTDFESIKQIGRQISDENNTPKQIMTFLNSGSFKSAVDTFSEWERVLDAAYGERRFVEMNINKSDIYK